jgi:thiol:disulfide interchange protein
VATFVMLSCGDKLEQQLTEAPFFTTFEEGLKVATADKPVLVDFYTDW